MSIASTALDADDEEDAAPDTRASGVTHEPPSSGKRSKPSGDFYINQTTSTSNFSSSSSVFSPVEANASEGYLCPKEVSEGKGKVSRTGVPHRGKVVPSPNVVAAVSQLARDVAENQRPPAATPLPPLPPRDEAVAPSTIDPRRSRPPGRHCNCFWKPTLASVIAAQLLITVALGGFCLAHYFAVRWAQTRIALYVKGDQQICSVPVNGTIPFAPDGSGSGVYWSYFKFDSRRHSVTVTSGGDYRISAQVCFEMAKSNASSVLIEIRVNESGWIRCHFKGSSLQTEGKDCCSLFSIKSMRRGDSVAVVVSQSGEAARHFCKYSKPVILLERRNAQYANAN